MKTKEELKIEAYEIHNKMIENSEDAKKLNAVAQRLSQEFSEVRSKIQQLESKEK